MEDKMPWQQGPLAEWAIVGMNHYHMHGERRMFVSMAKSGRCIKEEGTDDKYLWNRLMHQAWKISEETPNVAIEGLPAGSPSRMEGSTP